MVKEIKRGVSLVKEIKRGVVIGQRDKERSCHWSKEDNRNWSEKRKVAVICQREKDVWLLVIIGLTERVKNYH